MATGLSLEFEQYCSNVHAAAGEISSAEREQIVADLTLRFEHPNEYVAYIDEYPTQGRSRRLVRTLIAADASLRSVNEALAALSKKDRANALVEFVEPLNGAFTLPPNLSER